MNVRRDRASVAWRTVRDFAHRMLTKGPDNSTQNCIWFVLPRGLKARLALHYVRRRTYYFTIELDPVQVRRDFQRLKVARSLMESAQASIPKINGVPVATLTLKVLDVVSPPLTPHERGQFTRIFSALGNVDRVEDIAYDNPDRRITMYVVEKKGRR